MATASYRHPSSMGNANRARRQPRPFGQGILPARRPPTGPGWFDPSKPEHRADRLTLAELFATGTRPTTWPAEAARTTPIRPRGPVAEDRTVEVRPDGSMLIRCGQRFDAYLEGIAAELAAQPGPHARWLAAKVAGLARRARELGARDGSTFDDRDSADLADQDLRADAVAYDRGYDRGLAEASA